MAGRCIEPIVALLPPALADWFAFFGMAMAGTMVFVLLHILWDRFLR